MVIGTPAPCVRAFVAALDAAIRTHPPQPTLSVTPRTGLACCLTAVLVTTALCWARLARASLGTSARAALSWLCRPRQLPWEALLVARGQVIRRPHGITAGRLVVDAPDPPRATSAQALAALDKLRDQESGGSLWGHSRVCLVLGTPTISLPVGALFSPPTPERSAGDKTDQARKKPGGPASHRPRTPAPTPQYPTTEPLALRLLASGKVPPPEVRMPAVMAEAR
jgi:hypothetical protein